MAAMDVDGAAQHPQGKRRWPSAAAASRDDGAFYSFQQWLDFCQGDEEFARDLWSRAIDQDEARLLPSSEAQLRAQLAADVAALHLATPEDLAAGAQGIVLELRAAGLDAAAPGNSLRAGEGEAADFLGGAGSTATLAVEVVAAAPPTLQVRLRSCRGGYLRQRGAALDFGGSAGDEAEGTVFEVLVRDHPAPLISLGGKGGLVIGTFVPRWAPTAAWWRDALLQNAREAVEADEELQGRRRHPKDPLRGYHTFVEWVEHFDDLGWGGLVTDGALVLARLVWTRECIREGDDNQRREVHGFSKEEDDDADMEEWHWCPTDEDVQEYLKDGETVVSTPAAVAGTPRTV